MRHHPEHDSNAAARTEPTLGSLDTLPADEPVIDVADTPAAMPDERPPRVALPRRHGRAGWVVAAVILVIGGLWAWGERDTLRALLPDTQLNAILVRADTAFASGNLVASDGTSARELYSAARALAPDDERALDGLQKVGKAEFAAAEVAFKAGKLDVAGEALEQARALLGGGSDLDQLARDIGTARARGTQLASLLDRAQQAAHDGHPDSAAALYREMLTADPGNAVAQHGLAVVGDALATSVRKALADGNLADAGQRLQQLGDLVPSYSALPGLRADVQQAQAKVDADRTAALQQAAADLAAGRIDGPGDDNALARYRAVLAADPDNAEAHTGLRNVAAALLKRADAALDHHQFDVAATAIAAATQLAPDSVAVADARARLKAAQVAPVAADAPAAAASTAAPTLTDADRAKVQGLLTRAQAAAASGDLMLPPGGSAFDLYHAALAIDAGNADALAGLATLPSLAQQLFDTAINTGKPEQAADLLAGFSALAPGSAALPDMRTRLAGAWISLASRQADMGDLGAARQALGKARNLAPGDSRIGALAQRLGG